jgi:hypothetical protein
MTPFIPIRDAICILFPQNVRNGPSMSWWQWILQITGAWFYLALVAGGLWILVIPRARKWDRAAERIAQVTHRSISKTTFLLYPAAIGDIAAA